MLGVDCAGTQCRVGPGQGREDLGEGRRKVRGKVRASMEPSDGRLDRRAFVLTSPCAGLEQDQAEGVEVDSWSEVVTVDFGGTVHVWDYDAPFSPGGPAPWPQFHHDSRRTGSTEVTDLLGIDPASAAAPRTLELAAPHPNPARGLSQFAIGVPVEQNGAALELAVFDLAGRLVRVITSGPARAGRSTASWDTRDAMGERIPGGVYLVRLRAGVQSCTRKVVVLP